MRRALRTELVRAVGDVTLGDRKSAAAAAAAFAARVGESLAGASPAHAQLALAAALVEASARKGSTLVEVQKLIAGLWAAAKEGT